MSDFNNRDVRDNRVNRTERDVTTNDYAAARRRDRKHGMSWLPWAALALLLLLGLLIWWMMQQNNDDETSPTTSAVDVTTTAAGSNASTSTTNQGASGGQVTGNPSAQTASGVNLLDLASKGSIASAAGQDATLNNLEVKSVVADEGFWVGQGNTQMFVHLSPQARGNGESAPKVSVGQHVSAKGKLTQAPSDPGTLGIKTDEGAQQLREQGAYVAASSYQVR